MMLNASIETLDPAPQGMEGDNGDLNVLVPGTVELTKYLFDPGHERGFNNTHSFFEAGTEAGI